MARRPRSLLCGLFWTVSAGSIGRALCEATRIGGCERSMASCEGAGLDYLFKLRLTRGVRRLAERSMARRDWEDAGQGWRGVESDLRLQSRSRRVVILRVIRRGYSTAIGVLTH